MSHTTGRAWHRLNHDRGLCIVCWRENDQAPQWRCSVCAELKGIAERLKRAARRMADLEDLERTLLARQHELRVTIAKRRIARGNKRGRQRKVGQIGPTPSMRAKLAARQHPWQQAEDAHFAERRA